MIRTTGSDPAGLSPNSAFQQLKKRAQVLAEIRQYFSRKQVLEVETPLLRNYGVTDPHLDNLTVDKFFPGVAGTQQLKKQYLQTSPEYSMKQLLAMGSGSIYQLCKAFRAEQPGRLHSVEFTMLEWYRVGFSLQQLMDDVKSLVSAVTNIHDAEKISYREAFLRYANVDPLVASVAELKAIAKELADIDFDDDNKDTWLDLILTHCVESRLGQGRLTFLIDYPESQAALAKIKIDASGNRVADRFELYVDGIEIANGYNELLDVDEHLQRFDNDNKVRKAMGKPMREIDEEFINALRLGMPECAGVALGVDRLVMLA